MLFPQTQPLATPHLRIAFAFALALVVILTACASEAVEPIDATGVKAVWVFADDIEDVGWEKVHDDARMAADEVTGATTFVVTGIPGGEEFEQVVFDLIVTDGVNLVFGTSFEHMNSMERLAEDFTNVVFEHAGGFKKNDTNFGNYDGRMYEPQYVAGAAAAMTSAGGSIGYIAGFSFPEVIRGINAFTLGARSIDPAATVEVIWTSSDDDPVVEGNAARALIDIGADVIATRQDSPAAGQVAEAAGVRWIGFNSDLREFAPSAFVTATTWNFTQRYVDIIERVATETYEPEAFWGGLDDGVVGFVDPQGLDDDVIEDLAGTLDRVRSGKIKVFEGPITDQAGAEVVEDGKEIDEDTLKRMDFFVDGVIGTPNP